jgi:hypothetical protein
MAGDLAGAASRSDGVCALRLGLYPQITQISQTSKERSCAGSSAKGVNRFITSTGQFSNYRV